jgi:hypothetical protein
MSLLSRSLAAVALSILIVSPARAYVIWDFTETSLYYRDGITPIPGFTPHVTGSLTVPDADFHSGSISYSYRNHYLPPPNYPHCAHEVTGSDEFTLMLGPGAYLPTSPTSCNNYYGYLNLSFDAAGNISGYINIENYTADTIFGITDNFVTRAWAATDIGICPNTQCIFNGYWTLMTPSAIPEPSSLALFLSFLSMIGLIRLIRSKIGLVNLLALDASPGL